MKLVSIPRYADLLNQVLDRGWWRAGERGDDQRDAKVDQHANPTNAFGRDTPEPVLGGIGFGADKFEIDNIGGGKTHTTDHAGNRPGSVQAFGKNPQDNHRKEARSGQAEGKRHDLGDKPWRVNTEIASDNHRSSRSETGIAELLLLGDVRADHLFHQIMGNRHRQDEQQAGRGRQSGRQTARRDQGDDPSR